MRYTYLLVRRGDTLSGLAAAHGVTEDALRAANGIAPAEQLRAGQMLKIPAAAALAASPARVAPPVAASSARPTAKPAIAATARPVPAKAPAQPPAPVRAAARRAPRKAQLPAASPGPVASLAPVPAPALSGAITRGETGRQLLALTFEASFGEGATAPILKELQQAGLNSTWFLAGVWAEKHKGLAREIAAAGHQIECHAYSHPHLRELDAAQMREDVLRGLGAVFAATGRRPKLLRPPFGAHNRTLLQVASKLGLKVVLWTFDSLDWQSPGPKYVADRMVGLAQPGAIVRMHASAHQAPAALRLAIPRLRAAGYGFVTLEDLLTPGASAR